MKSISKLIHLLAIATTIILSGCSHKPLKALVVSGQNNHNWKVSHLAIKEILDNSGMFATDIALTPQAGGNMSSFNPRFDKYDVVVLDYNGDRWSETTDSSFLKYVQDGGGVIVYHAADNAFAGWEEFNKIIALGGWEGRNEKSGPYYYLQDGKPVLDHSPGHGGSHGMQREYPMHCRNANHPITKGLREEHLVFTVDYGKARIFHIMLGHCGPSLEDNPAMQCAGFQTLLLRGAEWSATGKVKQSLPADFPTERTVSLRKDYGKSNGVE